MSIKNTVIAQYQARIDKLATAPVRRVERLPEGWIKSMRKALGMSAAALARRLGRTRSAIGAAERAEIEERATLASMRTLAEGMGCKFVYAIVPANGRVSDLIEERVRTKAEQIAKGAQTHMALEDQMLKNEIQIEHIMAELRHTMPSSLWDE